MATCKDCIHYEVCIDYVCDEHFTKETNQTTREMFSPIGCENFKNKTDFVEVVRCKECANGCHKTDISVLCRIFNVLMITEDYCSYGCKKDEPTKIEHNSLCETETFEGR